MPFNDLAQSSSAKRGFADLFAASKAALDNIQAGLGGMLPSMPGMPVAKFGDLSIGIDMHPTVTPPSPVMPVPHVGKIYDLMADIMAGIAAAIPPATSGIAGVACNVLKGMAPSVKVHNQWIAQAGISILHLPAFVLHPAPLVSGMSESEMWMGSSTVLADGAPCSTLTHPSLSCNLVGIPTIPRKGKPKKVSKALMAPTSMLSTITSVGKPVLVGGPPTIDLFALTMKLGLKGIGKIWKKYYNKSRKTKEENMETKFYKKDKVLIFKITEEIDDNSVQKIRRRADYEIERYMPKRVIFDFDSVSFMDSAGIGLIIGRYKFANMLGGKLEVTNLTPAVKRIFEMSGILRLIPVTRSRRNRKHGKNGIK